MIIALPIAEEKVCMHFGHCQTFAFYEVDTTEKTITKVTSLVPPPHEPNILPPWIKEQGADVVITGGMGARAQNLFQAAGVQVVTGAPALDPVDVVNSYLQQELELSENPCDH
ncbi:MAG: NifB/NifX family molybdenum-iron cluster-binding protein [Firmicutes bacterium]|nr:NifB/NifX family molybdenum-iron cluster-binding protein [Bacillota bacterium]